MRMFLLCLAWIVIYIVLRILASPYDKRGFNRKGIHKNGTRYDDDGFDVNGYDKNGHNTMG